MKRFSCATLVLLGLIAALASGCVRTDEGLATRAPIPADSVTCAAPTQPVPRMTLVVAELDTAAAFTEYADEVMAVSTVSSVSVLPAELCDYSGQKLMGAWSDTPQQSVEFLDRIVHVWTDRNNYLVAVHVQAPAGTHRFDADAAVLTGDFAVELP